MRKVFYISAALLLAVTIFLSVHYSFYFLLLMLIVLPYALVGTYDCLQAKNNVNRNYPVIGHVKQFLVNNRELLQDWIFENEREIRPFDRIQREMVYHRAADQQQTIPFGTRYSYYELGYEWMLHSNHPSEHMQDDLRVLVGGKDCLQPYSSSILNVGGMSYGSISKNATMALNGGAQLGNFASNTGEGGLTDYHLHYGGDLIFQFGTGYFGCRTPDGKFDEEVFKTKARLQQVKMIEVKISQGAKPGYGAVLPGKKVTEEVARIRGIEAGKMVISPPGHDAFRTPLELMLFVKRLREASGGKPVGYKFCVGKPHEVIAMCKAMIRTGIEPDFITVDGSEGGTGAAHYESSNWVGMPGEDALPFVSNVLKGFGMNNRIRLFVSGKIISAFHVVRYLVLGADACYSARAMMFALGCVQALQCYRDTCPTGVTTMSEYLIRGLVPEEKRHSVYNYHRHTLTAVKDMLTAAGLKNRSELNRSLICRRAGQGIRTLEEIYPGIPENSLLSKPYPEPFRAYMDMADEESFEAKG